MPSVTTKVNAVFWAFSMLLIGTSFVPQTVLSQAINFNAGVAEPFQHENSFGDFDQDTDLDVLSKAAVHAGGQNLMRNQGNNTFLSGPIGATSDAAILADLNNDNYPDLITAQRGVGFRIWINNQAGGVALSQTIADGDFSPVQQSWDVAAADVDGDTDIDLMVTSYRTNSRLHTLVNQGGAQGGTLGSFQIGWQSPPIDGFTENTWMDFADLDGDNDPDFVTVGGNRGSNVWENNGDGTFTGRYAINGAITSSSQGRSSQWASVADIDGDTDKDIIHVYYDFGTTSYGMDILENTGTNDLDDFTPRPAVTYPTGLTVPRSVVFADFDGDGDPDLATSFGTGGSGEAYVYANDGSGTFTQAWVSEATIGGSNTNAYFLHAADVDGNGLPDLVSLNRYWSNANSPDDDSDGVNNTVEAAAPSFSGSAAGDGNNDGTQDSNQNHVISLPNAVTSSYLTFTATELGNSSIAFSAATAEAATGLPDGVALPLGQVSFTITGVTNGGTVSVQVIDHANSGLGAYYKFLAASWSDFSANASFNGQVTTLTLVDGGAGDGDGTANGTIQDPGGLAAALVQTAPAHAATAQSLTPAFTWTDSGIGAASYDLEYDTDPGFGSSTTISSITSPHTLGSALAQNTTYHWRLHAKNGSGGTIVTSATFSFTTGSLTLINPADAVTGLPLNSTFSWAATGLGATNYIFEIASDAGFSSIVFSVAGHPNESYALPYGVLATGTTYHWRVTARNGTTPIATSSTRSFTTAVDNDPIADGIEDAAPSYLGSAAGDGNNDGTPDKLQSHVASLPSAGGSSYVTVVAMEGTTPLTLAGISASTIAAHTGGGGTAPPSSLTFPLGLLNFHITGVSNGGTATVTIIDHASSGTTTYWKYNSTSQTWSDFSTNATFNGQVITLTLVDGGTGDDDGTANGEITDPSGPVVPPTNDGLAGLPATAIVQAGAFTQAGEAFVGTYGYGVYRWTNAGWAPKNNGLTNHWIYGLVISGTTLYAGTWGNGIFVSTDNGESWTQSGIPGTHVRGLAVNSSNEVYATGDFSEVWKLNGSNWEQVGMIAEYPTEPWGLAIDPGNSSHLYAATRYGLFESTDEGVSWTQTIHGVQTFSVEVHPTTRDVLVGTPTGIVRRTHGGTTFDLLRSSVSPVYALAFDRTGALYVGYWGPPGVEVSIDGGITWTTLELNPPTEAASKSGSASGRVVSVLVSPFDGTIIVSTDDGRVYVLEGEAASSVSHDGVEELPTSYGISQNYPNPFNPETVIGFEVPEASEVRVVVYDMLGRIVRVVHEGMTRAGRHEVTFEAHSLPSGVYMYRMETSSEVLTRMMMLMK